MATIAANLDRMVTKGSITEEDKHKTISNIITYHFSFFHLIALSTAYVDSGGFPIHCCNPIVFGICYLLSFSVRQMLLALRYLAL